MTYPHVKRHRLKAAERQGWRCYWCGVPMKIHEHSDHVSHPPDTLTAEHLTPRSKGGRNTKDNIVAACLRCNQDRADNTQWTINASGSTGSRDDWPQTGGG